MMLYEQYRRDISKSFILGMITGMAIGVVTALMFLS